MKNSRLIFIMILSATVVIVKLSNLFFAATISIIVLLLKLKSASTKDLITYLKIVALPALIFLVWSSRGIILTGCPVFPSSVGCINTKWAVPITAVKSESEKTYRFARYGMDFVKQEKTSNWLTPWLNKIILENKVSVVYPVCVFICAITALILLLLFTSAGKSMKLEKKYLLIPVPILTGLLFWFFIAPDLRFAYSLFWILPITAVYILLKIFETYTWKYKQILFLGVFMIANASIGWTFIQNPNLLTNISIHGYRPIKVADLIEQKTTSGLSIWIPKKDHKCWDSTIPCTPYFNPNLKFIGSDIRSGFTVKE